MTWTLLVILVVALSAALLVLWHKRTESTRLAQGLQEREKARVQGTHRARLQYPQVDLSRCIGCGSCVAACPEEGVLGLVHGQAVVLHGARCVGHGRCAQACPVNALAVTLGDLSERHDIPVLNEQLESPHVPGLFLAGEITGYALIRTAVAHGTAVADEVARRRKEQEKRAPAADALDLVIVGAGPAGLSCSLEAKSHGLSFVTIEQSDLGGTVAKYPRRKLVMTQPVELPLAGKLTRSSYEKEELVELWNRVAIDHELPIHTGQEFRGLDRDAEGLFLVYTGQETLRARNVCLALGRRGTPRKLGVPGEELAKVAYNLLDAQSYTGRNILVVGGGDSAVEAALGLAEQEGNQVALSYRRAGFTRLRSRNEARLLEAQQEGRLQLLMESEVARIDPESVDLAFATGARQRVANDDVFVFAGGTAPQELLESLGVSFDPGERVQHVPLAAQGAGLQKALLVALALTLLASAWVFLFRGYYGLDAPERPGAEQHEWLRPNGMVGLTLGIGAVFLVLVNLSYLLRRSARMEFLPGSLQGWMTVHVATGIGALLFALIHSAMAPHATIAGHALLAMAVLVLSGAVGRYFYAFVPRAANGRELALDEVQAELAGLSGDWDRQRPSFAQHVRDELQRLVADGRWTGSFFGRLLALARSQRRLNASLATLRAEGEREGLAEDQLDALIDLARRAQRTALMAAHYEDLRTLIASWRWIHRWVALALVLLVALHIAASLRYARFGG